MVSQAMVQIPEVVEIVVSEAEEVILEVVDGSKLVVRCIAIGSMMIAAIAMVMIGTWLLRGFCRLERHLP